MKGIEPSYAAWEAAVLPLNYARDRALLISRDDAIRQAPSQLTDVLGRDKITSRLIRPAGCTLFGYGERIEPFGLPLPERPGQQRNRLTHLARSCKGRPHARFSRCQGHGADPASIPHPKVRRHQSQREPGTGFQNARHGRLEHAVCVDPERAARGCDRRGRASRTSGTLSGHPAARPRAVPDRDLPDLRRPAEDHAGA